ncbi:MAG: hypothetical protein IJ717_01600 [Treponema sp.]|nr:hypothetical protein [Treponema sp.]
MKKIFKAIAALALLSCAGTAVAQRGDQATRSGGVEGESASTKNAVTVKSGLPYRQQFTIDVTKGNFALTKDNFRFEENPAGVKITSVQKSTYSETYWVSFSVNSGARGNLKFWLADNDANYVPITFNGTTGKVATMEVYEVEEEPMSDGIPQRYTQDDVASDLVAATAESDVEVVAVGKEVRAKVYFTITKGSFNPKTSGIDLSGSTAASYPNPLVSVEQAPLSTSKMAKSKGTRYCVTVKLGSGGDIKLKIKPQSYTYIPISGKEIFTYTVTKAQYATAYNAAQKATVKTPALPKTKTKK